MGFAKDIEDLQRRALAAGAARTSAVAERPETVPPAPPATVGAGDGDDPDVPSPARDD